MIVRGQLIRASDGVPLANTRVYLYGHGMSEASPYYATLTSPEGLFSFELRTALWIHFECVFPAGDSAVTPSYFADERKRVYDLYRAPLGLPTPPYLTVRPEKPDLASFPLTFVEYLPGLSLAASSPTAVMRELHRLGVDGYRTLATLARWPQEWGDVPPRGWFVPALTPLWHARFGEGLDEAKRLGLRYKICLFDDPIRNDKHSVVRAALRREGLTPSEESSFRGRAVSEGSAIYLADRYLDGIDPKDYPNLIVETCNEPHDWPGGWGPMPDDALAQNLQGRGFTVARGAWKGGTGHGDRYSPCSILSEHAWGLPGVHQPWPAMERLRALKRANPAAEIVMSSDGFGVERLTPLEMGHDTRLVTSEGHSMSALVRMPPDMWPDSTAHIIKSMVGGRVRA